MNDEQFEATKKRIAVSFYHWSQIFDFRPWTVTFVYDRTFPAEAGDITFFSTTFDWGYMLLTIRCNMPCIMDLDDREIDRCVGHELVHPILGEITDRKKGRADHSPHARRHVERVVTILTTALMKARDYGWHGVAVSEEPDMSLPVIKE